MTSSSARSVLRLELRRSALRRFALIFLFLLATAALWQSALEPLPSALLLAIALAVTVREAHRVLPVRLRINESDVIRLDWPDGREAVVELAFYRRLGGWLVLRLTDGDRGLWIDFWPDSLAESDRKALLRRLAGSLSSS